MPNSAQPYRVTFKRHIARSDTHTFCGAAIAQPRSYDPSNRLKTCVPADCDCRACAAHYGLVAERVAS